MSQRGVYFALLPEDVKKLRSVQNDQELLAVVQDDIEERWDEDWLFQTDKGCAGIHRCLTDGKLAYDNGEYPLRACVLGGEQLYQGDDFVVSFLKPEQVAEVASALAPIDKEWLRAQYGMRWSTVCRRMMMTSSTSGLVLRGYPSSFARHPLADRLYSLLISSRDGRLVGELRANPGSSRLA